MIKQHILFIFLTTTALISCTGTKSVPDEPEASSEERSGSYTIWFVPQGELLDEFSQLIIKISDEYGSPKFKPHVTLLGSLTGFTQEEVLSKATELAKSIEPFEITLTEVTYPSSYPNDYEAFYRSLYILAQRTEPLMHTNELARKLYVRESDPQFNPHLSIMYGPYPPKTKDEIISQVGREFDVSFEADSIHVWSDKGLPRDWKFIKRIPLGKH